jgi:hypothetical protein
LNDALYELWTAKWRPCPIPKFRRPPSPKCSSIRSYRTASNRDLLNTK